MFSQSRSLPARHLIALILGITVVPLATLLWLGWHELDQDRVLENQQANQRLDQAAKLLVAALHSVISVSAQRLASDEQQWPEGAVAVTFHDNRIEAHPKERVAYFPVVPQLPEPPDAIFNEADTFEYQKQDHAAAIGILGNLANSPDPAIRAGALLRLGNSLDRIGQTSEALAAYDSLTRMDNVAFQGVPASLFSLYARCLIFEKSQRIADLHSEANRLATGLSSGRWPLKGPVYSLYASNAAHWSNTRDAASRQSEIFAEATAVLWEQWQAHRENDNEPLTVDGMNLTVLRQNSAGTLRALIATSEFVDTQWLAAAIPVARDQHISFRIGGTADPVSGLWATRKAAQSTLPWDVTVTSTATSGGEFLARRRLLIAGFALLVLLALAANYLIIRALNREFAVARLQSDFVSAVSHEFRTPLTSLRQFTDMLLENKHPDGERRMLCYEAQSRATDRLTRLVESLLDFGRMEAGAHRYKFAERDCTELVARVVEDFRAEAKATGYEVQFSGNGSAMIDADSEALGRAVWNFLDNAVKYSPDHHVIEVDLSRYDGDVRIIVRDHGIGVPAGERTAIFNKFQRGEEARTRGIKGTGIGLAMANEIVKAHRGWIEVESEPGKGSAFTIVLPARG